MQHERKKGHTMRFIHFLAAVLAVCTLGANAHADPPDDPAGTDTAYFKAVPPPLIPAMTFEDAPSANLTDTDASSPSEKDDGKTELIIKAETPDGETIKMRIRVDADPVELTDCERSQAKGYLIWCAPAFKEAVRIDSDPWSDLTGEGNFQSGGVMVEEASTPHLKLTEPTPFEGLGFREGR